MSTRAWLHHPKQRSQRNLREHLDFEFSPGNVLTLSITQAGSGISFFQRYSAHITAEFVELTYL
jgi:hypothetical protein